MTAAPATALPDEDQLFRLLRRLGDAPAVSQRETAQALGISLGRLNAWLRAEKILQHRLFKHPKVEVLWNHTLEEVLGADSPLGVEAVRVKSTETGETVELPAKGVFVAIGHAPASELVKDQLELHNGGYVVVEPGSTRTSIPGVFAAGDLTDHVYRQAVTSAGMGCMAALDAEKFLAESEDSEVEKDTTLPLGYGAPVGEAAAE